MQKMIRRGLVMLGIIMFCLNAQAQIQVKDAWARASVLQQKSTGVFLQIVASQEADLVAVETKAAQSAEMHEMRMVNDTMHMQEIERVHLSAGQVVTFAPGGMHIMLMGLQRPLKVGEDIVLKLSFEMKNKKRKQIEVKAQVRALGEAAK